MKFIGGFPVCVLCVAMICLSAPAFAALAVDTDRDGLSDHDEMHIYGSDPDRADTDGDGLRDGDERAFWGEAWLADSDGDGLINLLDPDADNDGAELNDGTDPLDRYSFLDPASESGLALDLLPIVSVQASEAQAPHAPEFTIDGDIATRWAAQGGGQWIAYDMGTTATVSEVGIVWFADSRPQVGFAIEASDNGVDWFEVFRGVSNSAAGEFELYAFAPAPARYLRIANTSRSSRAWISIVELEIYGQINTTLLPLVAAQASDAQGAHTPEHTIDGNMATRWAAQGDGQWIAYDLGAAAMVSEVAIAWFQGDRRRTLFAIETSLDGSDWAEVFRGGSSGATSDFETYTFAAAAARYLRIVGDGNASDAWISIHEVECYGQVD
jgi:hypothetical protein